MGSEPVRAYILSCEDPLFSANIFQYIGSKLPQRIVGVGFAPGLVTSERLLKTPLIYGPFKFIKFSVELILASFFAGKVERASRSLGIKVDKLESIKSPEFFKHLRALKVNLIISINCNSIIGAELRSLPHYGVINLHNGELPRYRGLMPILHAIRLKEKQIGVTIQEIDSGKIDSGPIRAQSTLPIELGDNLLKLWERATTIGADLLCQSILDIEQGNVTVRENKEEEATYFSLPSLKEIFEYHQAVFRLKTKCQ